MTIVRTGLDAFVLSAAPNTNFSTAPRLRVQSGAAESFVFFKSPVPTGGDYTVTSAILRLRGDTSIAGSVTVSAQRVNSSWKTRLLTWNNKPGVVGSVVSDTVVDPTNQSWFEIDVTAHVQSIANGAPNYGWKLTSSSGTLLRLWSLDGAQYKPTLIVEYTDKPEKTGMLTPYGGLAVATDKPVLRFSFSDPGGDDGLDAVNVQIDAGNVFTSGVDFDSGWVSTSVPELDLSTTAYAGLADGATTYWRARTRDDAGGISDWSDVASFSRDDKGTLTITSPAAAPSNFVDEFTPPIAWTFTGETQKAYRVRVGLASNPGVWRYDSGKIVSTATEHTLPLSVNGRRILFDDQTYVVQVLIWDTKDRVGVTHVASSREFTVQYDATVDAATALTATAGSMGRPWVTLDWQRATLPDEWIIMRDGEVIERADIASDLLVSGTAYQFVDYTARPFIEHTYKIKAVVNNKTALSNPTATITPECKGFWLVNDDATLEVLLSGDDIENMAYGEDAAVHIPLGADSATRIVAGMRGLEGSFAGIIRTTEDGRTWDDWKQDLLAMKASPSTVYRAAFGDENIPVVLGDVSVSPSRDTNSFNMALVASVAFWQAGDLPFEAEL